MRSLLKVLLLPLVWLFSQFRLLQAEVKERLSSSGQTRSLIEALRRAYRLKEGDVYIIDSEHKQPHLYLKEKNNALCTSIGLETVSAPTSTMRVVVR